MWWPLIGFFIGFILLLILIGYIVNLKPEDAPPHDPPGH